MIFCNIIEDKKTFIINAFLSANKGRSFTVDILYVYDPVLLKTIAEMPEKEYFENKNLLSRENKLSLSIHSMEVLPGKAYAPYTIDISSSKELISCVIFVDFSMIQGRINRKIILGKDLNTVTIYFDDQGVNLLDEI